MLLLERTCGAPSTSGRGSGAAWGLGDVHARRHTHRARGVRPIAHERLGVGSGHDRREQGVSARRCRLPDVQTRAVLTSAPAPAPTPMLDPKSRAQARSQRFTKLVELRALYRDFMRAKALISLKAPVYTPPVSPTAEEATSPTSTIEVEASAKERELEELERRKEAVDVVAEMQLTADLLKSGLRSLPAGFGDLFPAGPATPEEYEARVREQAWQYITQLRERVQQELPNLPFGSREAAQAALDARNARYTRGSSEGPSSPLSSLSSSNSSSNGWEGPTGSMVGTGGILLPGGSDAAQQLANSIEKLGQAEKVAEQFVATRIKPVLRKAREGELVDMVRETGAYLKGLWIRLNGGGSRTREPALSPDLPLPSREHTDRELAVSQLSLELDGIESRLREAARAREAKLRKVRAPEGRATIRFQLKMMDEEVSRLSRELAVRMLQMEMEYAYSSLEDEVIDIASSDLEDVLQRQGSTTELRLLAAEFAYLDEQLAELADQITRNPASTAASHAAASHGARPATPAAVPGLSAPVPAVATAGAEGHSAGNGAGIGNVVQIRGVPVSVDELLELLGTEVPDMRQRAGVPDQVVFGGQGFTLTKARLQVLESLDKLREAVTFMARGIKLLGSDINAATRLFGRAAMGGTLKPREVSALRRTARDLLTFIPFTIILIIPLTPLGHVLIYGFIQQYFPSFFPSCFTGKRQELMVRYEELERQLLAARSQAEQVEEEAELVKAAAAVATVATQGSVIKATAGLAAKRSGNSTAAAAVATGKQRAGGDVSGLVGSGIDGALAGAAGIGAGNEIAGAWHDFHSIDEAADVAVAQQTAQVRALEERIAAVSDDLTLGDDPATSTGEPAANGKKEKKHGRR